MTSTRAAGDRSTWTKSPAGDPDNATRVIFVSNRGPVEYHEGDDGEPAAQRGAGGVVSGLLCAAAGHRISWIAAAMTNWDRHVARTLDGAPIRAPAGLDNLDVRLVDVPPAVYRRYYAGISNRVLWFAQHYLLRPGTSPVGRERVRRDWERGYRTVNAAVADAVVAEVALRGKATPILFQDYHLYLAPGMVRARCPDARLGHFIHIPWPDPRYWEMLPDYLVSELYAGLTGNDYLAFQTSRDAGNFLDGAARFLPDAEVERCGDETMGLLTWGRRQVRVGVRPIAVNPEEVFAAVETPEARAEAEQLSALLDTREARQLIVRVDRVDPTKNIVRGFEAFEALLSQHPELHGRVTFLALLVPSRQGVGRYGAYARQVQRVIERVNARFGRPDWQPIVALYGNNRARALACLRRYDVLLVNPLIDGMNLVVKEGGLLNTRSGSVVLSRTAGAYEQLNRPILGIAPLDVEATAEALYYGLTMPQRERLARARVVKALLQQETATTWLEAQLTDLEQGTWQRAARALARREQPVRLLQHPAVAGATHTRN